MTDLDHYLTDEVVEEAARAAFDDGFLRYAPEHIARWGEEDDEGVRESWRVVAHAALEASAPLIAAHALRDALARIGRAAYAVDSTHHFHDIQCSCGFTGDARKRTQTEHITAAVLEAYDRIEQGGQP